MCFVGNGWGEGCDYLTLWGHGTSHIYLLVNWVNIVLDAEPSPETVMTYCQFDSHEQNSGTFSMTSPCQNPNFQTKKYQYLFLRPMYQIVESITDRHWRTLTHRHTWFDQGQPTIQLILLVIEPIQEVKTTLVNLIKMGNRFSY